MSDPARRAAESDALFLKVLPIFQDLVSDEGLIDVYDSRDVAQFNTFIDEEFAVEREADVERVWNELLNDKTVEAPNWSDEGYPHYLLVSESQLAAALKAGKGDGE